MSIDSRTTRMFFFLRVPVACIFLLGLCPLLLADATLPGLFSDHMVLQQGREISVWGWATPGEKITVTLAGESRQTAADGSGNWKVMLPPLTAGGPFLLQVRGTKTVLLKDIMIGEVWVFSGQSNMTFALSGTEGAATQIPAANHPEIRLFTVPEQSTLTPQQNVTARWELCTPDTARKFSAVAYFFGRALYQQLHVPIGLIHSSWPGTDGESWTPAESLRSSPQLASILQTWNGASTPEKHLAADPLEFDLQFDDFKLLPAESVLLPRVFSDFNDGESHNTMGGLWTYDWPSAPGSEFDLLHPGRDGSGYAAHVSGQLAVPDVGLLNSSFSPDGSAADLSPYSGITFYYRGDGYFRYRSRQPSIFDYDDYRSPLVHATADWQQATILFKDLRQDGWGIPEAFTPQSLSSFALEILRGPDAPLAPSSLFNGMIAPLIPYAIRGAVWYQGESNAMRGYQYRALLPALIQGWRQAWNEGDFAFLIAQLPNLGRREDKPGESAWAELREAQFMALRVPNTGLAVTIDLGDVVNLHPPRKAEVGQRLALWALGTTYHKDIVYSGPLYDSMQIDRNRIRIHFTHVGSGLEARDGGELREFAVAGSDRIFHWARAIIDGDSVVVSSPEVSSPVAVRYGWAGNPDCNLYNREGLPASPFRTDDWQAKAVNGK